MTQKCGILFVDFSKKSLKAVLLQNGDTKPSMMIYKTMAKFIELIKYECHNWHICGDLEVIGTLLVLQHGTLSTVVSHDYGTQEQSRI